MKIVVKYQFAHSDDCTRISSTSTILDIDHVTNSSIKKAIEATLSSGEELVMIQKITALKQNITVVEKPNKECIEAIKLLHRVYDSHNFQNTHIGSKLYDDIGVFLTRK